MYGSTFKHNKVLIGMTALLPYCFHCDSVKTQGSHSYHFEVFGKTQAELFSDLWPRYQVETNQLTFPPIEVIQAIEDYGK